MRRGLAWGLSQVRLTIPVLRMNMMEEIECIDASPLPLPTLQPPSPPLPNHHTIQKKIMMIV